MTIIEQERNPDPASAEMDSDAADRSAAGPPDGTTGLPGSETPPAGAPDGEQRTLRIPMVALAALLSCSASAFLGAGLVRGVTPRLIALLGVALGVGFTSLSFRFRRPALVQYAVLPVAVLLGGALIAPAATGGTATLPGLVAEVFHTGGLRLAPVPFDPGWRFLLVVIFALLSAASLAIAVERGRAKIAVALPLPVTLGAALLQPKSSALLASSVGIFLVIGSVALAYGAELAGGTGTHTGFEVRRLGRGAALLAVLMAMMVGLTHASFLFPASNQQRVIPPRRPPVTPPEKDRQLFTVDGTRPGPWRLGVLDVYQSTAWLLPSLDNSRIHGLAKDGSIPNSPGVASAGSKRIHFHLVDLKGRVLPVPAGLLGVVGTDSHVSYDARIGVPQLDQRVPRGFDYTAVALPEPTAQQMNAAPAADPGLIAQYTSMPQQPAAVRALLAGAPQRPFDRLQYIRAKLYSDVIAAGGGQPVDVPPARVSAMLQPKTQATPYEITAAEAMLARWAGVPARIGFGYYGGDPISGGYSLRPRNAAVWLEAYFTDYGWVPLVGTPPRATASLNDQHKQPNVLPSDNLQVTIYVPVQRPTVLQLFEIIRYWLLHLLPLLLVLGTAFAGYPALLKMARSWRRRRWATAHGPLGRILVGYADFRDRCNDLNFGGAHERPLGFVARFSADSEHEEIAWAVTRVLWGDLRRDVRAEDAAAIERMLASLQRRVSRAQPSINRLIAGLSRASLRDPWTDEVPNLWPQPQVRQHLARAIRRFGRWTPRTLSRRLRPAAAALIALVTLAGCAHQGGFTGAEAPADYPASMVPAPPTTLAGLVFEREPKAERAYRQGGQHALVTDGRVYSMRDGSAIVGTLQVALLLPRLDGRNPHVQALLEGGLGGGFTDFDIGTIRMRTRDTVEQRLFLWFPPERNVMVLFVLSKSFSQAVQLVEQAAFYERGIDPDLLAPLGPPEVPGGSPATASTGAPSPQPTGSAATP
jgi:hypothetical protein